MDQVMKHRPPVLVALYHPGRDSLRYLALTPGDPSNAERDDHVGGTSTIGMLADYLERRDGSHFTFRVGDPEFERMNVGRMAVFA
ncbi:hypothetical protein SAMN05216184_10481 [Georgenia satyanarayanai]|uniref:Uncharacterized protein n=2 Tax=Georgenia satyanarayanai TaxID=860221 RepID=A0A2Y9A7Q5_9MICO|nr:hypothetical protein A8987_10481 [Georgenia satyanarayanai]SSA40225.1 hypothetical protein SAMN05216184_10481 [Georgenia satyanarayanai]